MSQLKAEFGTDMPTCTGKLVEWNKGRRKNKNPITIFNKEYPSMKKNLKFQKSISKDVIKSDTRPEELQQSNLSNEQKNEIISSLLINGQECGWTNLLDFHYDNFSVDDYGVDVLEMQCRQFINKLDKVCFNKCSPFVVEKTLGQPTSPV